MSRAPYQKLGNGPAASSSSASRPAPAKSPKEQQSADKHRARNVETDNDPQAPWLTNLEYSVDPLLWVEDSKHNSCPLCSQPFVVTLMGSGKHHCRMVSSESGKSSESIVRVSCGVLFLIRFAVCVCPFPGC